MASVTFRNIEKSFGKVNIIHGISFDISDGEFVVLVGPSGCGKSTLLRMLAGLEEITKGEIAIDGKVINDLDSKDRDIAMVFQSYALYPHMTVRDNMAFSLKLRKADAALTSQRVGDAARILNLDPLLDRFPRELSGGQRQRVAIARAILKNPAILLLDEATSALDSESEKLVQGAMDELMKNRTSIIIAHRLSTIRKVDKILVIDGGRIVEQGSHEELADNENGLYANLLKLQFELS